MTGPNLFSVRRSVAYRMTDLSFHLTADRMQINTKYDGSCLEGHKRSVRADPLVETHMHLRCIPTAVLACGEACKHRNECSSRDRHEPNRMDLRACLCATNKAYSCLMLHEQHKYQEWGPSQVGGPHTIFCLSSLATAPLRMPTANQRDTQVKTSWGMPYTTMAVRKEGTPTLRRPPAGRPSSGCPA